MTKVLLIAGLTAVGKTRFAVDVAHRFNGELVSADSRQVYQGLDIITGKDKSRIDVPIWLYDLVRPDEPFSVSQWHTKAVEAIQNISSRGKLPVVVGGTGLYLRSLVEPLSGISVPPDPALRSQNLSIIQLQQLLGEETLNKMNSSDRQNPRRLTRYIELAQYNQKKPSSYPKNPDDVLSLVLTAPLPVIKDRISHRVMERLTSGALEELTGLAAGYDPSLPAFTACGYRSLLNNPDPENWIRSEYQYARRQKTYFSKYFPQNITDITVPGWQDRLLDIISLWTAS